MRPSAFSNSSELEGIQIPYLTKRCIQYLNLGLNHVNQANRVYGLDTCTFDTSRRHPLFILQHITNVNFRDKSQYLQEFPCVLQTLNIHPRVYHVCVSTFEVLISHRRIFKYWSHTSASSQPTRNLLDVVLFANHNFVVICIVQTFPHNFICGFQPQVGSHKRAGIT
jgi:hypothetical protein